MLIDLNERFNHSTTYFSTMTWSSLQTKHAIKQAYDHYLYHDRLGERANTLEEELMKAIIQKKYLYLRNCKTDKIDAGRLRYRTTFMLVAPESAEYQSGWMSV
jgi:hypothetical protein